MNKKRIKETQLSKAKGYLSRAIELIEKDLKGIHSNCLDEDALKKILVEFKKLLFNVDQRVFSSRRINTGPIGRMLADRCEIYGEIEHAISAAERAYYEIDSD